MNGKIICIGVGDAHLGRTTLDRDGNVISSTPARWEPNPEGGAVAMWSVNPETMEPDGAAELFGDWDAARYLARVLELIQPNRQINIPDLEAMIRAAAKSGEDICTYCPDYNCRDCIVNEWKGDPDDEQDEN